jgi:hypothetical protein
MLQRVEISYQNHGELERANKAKDIFFAREVKTCIDVAEKFPKNYYAWTHRRYLWDLFSFDTSGTELRDEQKKIRRQHQQRQRYIQLLETELMIGMWQEWLPKHPADHSAVHYSCQVLDLLLHEMILLRLDSEQQMLEDRVEYVCFSALEQVRVLMSKFSHENESLWILRRITCKILWKHLYSPSIVEECSAKTYFFNEMTVLVYLLVRNDLKSILSSTLSIDVELQQGDNSNYGENASGKIPNPTSMHALTFLAWCIANLDGIDDHSEWEGTYDNFNASRNDVIFTPRIREIVWRHLTSTTGTIHHNHLVYTSSPSPFF